MARVGNNDVQSIEAMERVTLATDQKENGGNNPHKKRKAKNKGKDDVKVKERFALESFCSFTYLFDFHRFSL